MKYARLLKPLLPCAALGLTLAARADNARFDLVGPRVDVRVTRGDKSLPIAEVPNLQPGDKLWVKADLPDSQKNHLLLIVAFLRGTTNEPPDNWFTEIDTWERKQTAEGTTVVVPQGAEQALLFIAPETGGDFKTLRSAVKGKPGLFIRADADLNEASFEQQRIVRYLAAMKTVPEDDPKAIQDHSAKLATTLALKPNPDCFKQPVEAQVNCLTQSSAPVLLADGHGQSIAESLSSGPSSDFINAASYTGAAGGGLYSAYVGAVVDLVHLVSTLHTAKYQYIPGLSFPQDQALQLKLNAPVSFVDPKSVIVIGLPAIQKAVPPPLRAHDPKQVACLLQPHMALQLEGAPLVFSTSFAHDLTLHLNRASGSQEIPLTPDAFEGGLAVGKADPRKPLLDSTAAVAESTSASPKPAAATDLTVTGTVHGFWGFDPFEGPTLTLQQQPGKGWKIVSGTPLLAGEENHLTLDGDGTACVQHIELASDKDSGVDVHFKPAAGKDDGAHQPLTLDVPLKEVQPGGYALAIRQFGDKEVAKVGLTAYDNDIHLASLKIHEGDEDAVLDGAALSNVAEVTLGSTVFLPAGEANGSSLALKSNKPTQAKEGDEATVKLKDGRTLPVRVDAQAARPSLTLASLEAEPTRKEGTVPVVLSGKNEIALNSTVHFVVTTQRDFPRDQKVEVATTDGSLHTLLSLANNTLILQDPHTAIATLDPLKAFGRSAFGMLQMRPVAADGTSGDWTPLGKLVRTPEITAVTCPGMPSTAPSTAPPAAAASCTLSGSELFLLQEIGSNKDFDTPAAVPSGYSQGSLQVPPPANGSTLYLKLRDDPEDVATITLPKAALPAPGTASQATTASATGDAPGTASPAHN